MMIASVDWVLTEVLQCVVHPAHVPLKAEAQPSYVGRPADSGPRGRLLCNNFSAWEPRIGLPVQFLQEGDCLQIFATAENIWKPLTCLARVVEIEHGRYRVYAEPVGVIFSEPVVRARQEEHPDFISSKIENVSAPIGLETEARIEMLVKCSTVEAPETERVGRKVRRYPVKNHSNVALMKDIDQVLEVVGIAKSGGRCEISAHLISPRSGEGMLHHRHEFDVGESQISNVVGQLVRHLAIGQRAISLLGYAAPRAKVNFVDRQGLSQRVATTALLDPAAVVVSVLRIEHHRRRPRRHFH